MSTSSTAAVLQLYRIVLLLSVLHILFRASDGLVTCIKLLSVVNRLLL